MLRLNSQGEMINQKDIKTLSITLVGNAKVGTIYKGIVPQNMKLINSTIKADVAPVGASLTIDVLKNGTSVLSKYLTLADTTYISNEDIVSLSSFSKNDTIEIKIVTTGATQSGYNIMINLGFNLLY